MPGMDDLLSRSGMEFMQDMIAGRLPGPPIGATLGFAPVSVEEGRGGVRRRAAVHCHQPDERGAWRLVRAILDSCMGCAVMTRVPRGSVYTTLEYKVNITRAIPLGTRVRAIGTVDHAGRSTGVASGEIRGIDDDKLYATSSTTCLIMKMA